MIAINKKRLVKIIAALLFVVLVLAIGIWLHAFVAVVLGFCSGLLISGLILYRANLLTKRIFRFYVAANEVLTATEQRPYRFEVAKVIKLGERVVRQMPDPPPLSRFALGALYSSIGDHSGAVEQLAFAAEEEVLKDSSHMSPSPKLRRYVERLRRIQRDPKRWTNLKAAIANLERMHQEKGAALLAENQKYLKRIVEAFDNQLSEQTDERPKGIGISPSRSLKSITAPPPISDVLNEIYQEEQNASRS